MDAMGSRKVRRPTDRARAEALIQELWFRDEQEVAQERDDGLRLLPPRFKCPECGCEVVRQHLRFTECAWCGGNGRRVKE